jgi:hypothetical protein
MKRTFTAVLGENGVFELPFDVRAAYGAARPAVKMTLFGETFRTRVMVYGGKSVLGVWKAVRAAHGLDEGQTIEVTVEPDTAPRTVEPPAELAAALKRNPAARTGWKALAFTHQREWATAIQDAKRPETRERRVAQAIAALAAKARAPSAAPRPASSPRTPPRRRRAAPAR